MTADSLRTDQSGPVLVVTFNNPPRHFFDERMSIELDELTRALRRDSTVRAVVFAGPNRDYITHFDVPSLLRGATRIPVPVGYRSGLAVAATAFAATGLRADRLLRHGPLRDILFLARTYAALDRLTRLDQVVITEIGGLAVGMGTVFALACDIRLMADDATIGLVESGLGVLAGAGGTQRLTRLVGPGVALELLLDGRWISATDAARLRLVHQVLPADELRSRAMEIAHRLAARSPVVTRELKRAVLDTATRSGRRASIAEAAGLIRTLTSRDARQSLAAYNEHLATHETLTDEVIRAGWRPLLGHDPVAPPQARS